jgi:RNA polymerase-binding transcription factor DksA
MADLEDVKQKLQDRLGRLVPRLARIEGHLRRPGDRDWPEQASEAQNDEVLERLDETERREVEEIRGALSRIAEGRYGQCASCGEIIPERRLEALPYATHCVGCAGS